MPKYLASDMSSSSLWTLSSTSPSTTTLLNLTGSLASTSTNASVFVQEISIVGNGVDFAAREGLTCH